MVHDMYNGGPWTFTRASIIEQVFRFGEAPRTVTS